MSINTLPLLNGLGKLQVAAGEFKPLHGWLLENIYRHGRKFTPGELLERTTGKRRTTPTDEADTRALAGDLDGLALALEQAGAFVRKHACTLAAYRQRWAAGERKVRDTLCMNPGSEAAYGIVRGYIVDVSSSGIERTFRVEG